MKSHKLVLLLPIIYIFVLSIFMLSHRIWFSPDQFFIFGIIGSLMIGRARMFIFDWVPFLTLFLGYEFLRSLIPFLSGNVHILPMIRADKLLFGEVPTITLQNSLYNPSNLKWYDYLTVILYISHFVIPMLVGYLFWILDRRHFRQYAFTLLLVSYMGFFTFIVFPAMPPWMAAGKGYIPQVHEVISVVMSHFWPSFNLPTVYTVLGADPVAAVPSLHVAFPFVVFLFVLKKSKKFAIFSAIYVVLVVFSVIYLGEHYFTDAVIGIIYATIAFILISTISNGFYGGIHEF